MSYSLKTKCFQCEKYYQCVDSMILSGAIQGIHSAGSQRGHLGSGVINLDCSNFMEALPAGNEGKTK